MSNNATPQIHKAEDTKVENILNISEILRIVRLYWKEVLGVVFIFISLALILALVLPKKWEASATLRIARVPMESSELKVIEDPLQTVERMKLFGFKEKILSSMQLPTEKGLDSRTDLILSSLKTSAVKNTEFINISVRGYSKKDAMTTIQVATTELKSTHAQMTLPIRNRISNELQATNKNLATTISELDVLKSQMANAGTYKSESEFSPRIIAIELLTSTEATRRALELQQILLKDRLASLDEQSTKIVSTINIPKKQVFPKLSGFLILGALLGLLSGIGIALWKNKK